LTNKPPLFRPEQEVRFALVLYGGVSLAVYINGVVQEFFRLVRSTAPEWPLSTDPQVQRAWFPIAAGGNGEVKPLTGSERVYRRLGQLLPQAGPPDDPSPDAPIRTRFVVDILSGSSAGGINGIFLAKALANQQSIDRLRDLWVNDGDISALLNDRSVDEGEYKVGLQRPPRSLLNGYRLLVKALGALEKMAGTEEREGTDKSPSYAEQIDLAVTTTDLQGLVLPIKLYDRVVHEAKHKHVFRFAYWTKEATGADRNDFGPENDPLLAFAARCTSSFPFAFEPMVLNDLADVLSESDFPPDGKPWGGFFGDHLRMGAEYRGFAFADGGYLDNKPFTYATEQLGRRRADVPVERKLVYIEPDPSETHFDPTSQPAKERPEVFQNVVAAVTGLPRAETIREDVDAVVRRSRAVARIRGVTGQIIAQALPAGGLPPASANPAYRALRSEVVLDELAEAIGRAAGIAEDSDALYALRLVAGAWAAPGVGEAEPLSSLDLGFRLRRLTFLQHRINDRLRELRSIPATGNEAARLKQVKMALNEVFVELRWRGRGLRRPRTTAAVLAAQPDAMVAGAADAADSFAAVAQAMGAIGFTPDDLVEAILGPGGTVRSESRARANAATFVEGRVAPLNAVASAFRGVLDLPLRAEAAAARLVLGGTDAAPVDAEAEEEAVRWLFLPGEATTGPPAVLQGLTEIPAEIRDRLRWYYDSFPDIDAMLLPLTYPDLGEVNPVEVIRISPQDATSLIDEATDEQRRHKLAGTSVHHFGGFLDRRFRVNDILWGRLDGAERIIQTTLPPGHSEAARLIEAAQLAIIREDLLGDGQEPWVADALKDAPTAVPLSGAAPADLIALLGPGWDADSLQAALAVRACLATTHEVDREPDRRQMLNVVGRGTSISSEVVGAAADSIRAPKKPLFWVARVGRLLTGLAALATPRARSLPRLVFRNVAVIALLIGVALIVLGILGVEGAQMSGWIVLGATALAQVAVWAATAWVGAPSRRPGERRSRLGRWLLRFVITIVTIVLLAALFFGLVEGGEEVIDWLDEWWPLRLL
jgi:predicted acylesterase/phospholipase RssA